MNDSLLEVGKVLNTHGVRGEIKVQSWCDSPEVLCALETVYIGRRAFSVLSGRVHAGHALLRLAGVDDMDAALALKNSVLLARREDMPVEEGAHFVVDLIGLQARHAETGEVLGRVTDVLEYPAHDIYVVEGEKRYLIPDVPTFVRAVRPEEGYIDFLPLEGMGE